jgi:hypothetical protein
MPKLTTKDKMMLGMERAGELEDHLGRTPTTAELNKFLKTGKLPNHKDMEPKSKPTVVASPTTVTTTATSTTDSNVVTTTTTSTPVTSKTKTKSEPKSEPKSKPKSKSKKRTKFYYRQSYGTLIPAKATNLKGLVKEVQALVVKDPDQFPDGTVLELLQVAETFTVKHSISFKK